MCAASMPASASAQSYIAGAVAAEIVRTTSTKSGNSTYDNGSGEVAAGAIRVGSSITDRFGVELEFYRPGQIELSQDAPIYYAAGQSLRFNDGAVNVPGIGLDPRGGSTVSGLSSIAPFQQETRTRVTTTSALAFVTQPLGAKASLVYLGGIGFSRVVRETEFDYQRAFPIGITIPSSSTRTTQYGAGPVVGVETRIGMTEHARVVAGVRLHTLGQNLVDGWMIRPSVGLAWAF
jgi:opacity protein-like surface antigen